MVLNFIAVADHSTESKPCETLMQEREPRARAGAKREGSQLAALMPCLCRPERCEAKVCEVSESHTAKEPSDMPTTSWPAADQLCTSGSNSLWLEENLISELR